MILKYCDPGDMFAFSSEITEEGPQNVYSMIQKWGQCRLVYPFEKSRTFCNVFDLSAYAERDITLLRPTKFETHE